MMSTFKQGDLLPIDVFEVTFFLPLGGRNRWGKLDFFHFLCSLSFIDVYSAKTIMEICYALGAMEEIFMAVFFYSPGYVRSDNNEIYCFLKCGVEKKRKKVLLWWDGRVSKRTLIKNIVSSSDRWSLCGWEFNTFKNS